MMQQRQIESKNVEHCDHLPVGVGKDGKRISRKCCKCFRAHQHICQRKCSCKQFRTARLAGQASGPFSIFLHSSGSIRKNPMVGVCVMIFSLFSLFFCGVVVGCLRLQEPEKSAPDYLWDIRSHGHMLSTAP